jgi:DnaJ-class molecular chaperone
MKKFVKGFSNSYKILGLKLSCTKEEIKEAYYNLCKVHHPDHNKGIHTDRYIEIQDAYQQLANTHYEYIPTSDRHLDEILNKVQMSYKNDGGYMKKQSFNVLINDKSLFCYSDLQMLRKQYRKALRPSRQNTRSAYRNKNNYYNHISANTDKKIELLEIKPALKTTESNFFVNKKFEAIYYTVVKTICLASLSSFIYISIPLEYSVPLTLYICYLTFKKEKI